MRPAKVLLPLVFACPLSLLAQSTPEFPTTEEINTLMQQANLAMKQYQTTMLEETAKIGKDADAVENEKKALENWQFLASVMKSDPSRNFNSGVGFMVVEQLNTAYGTSLACEINALTTLNLAPLLKDENRQNSADDVSKACMSAAQLLAVVKLSAYNLYLKYLQAQKVQYEKTFNTVMKCGEALKKVTANRPQ